MHIIKPMRSAAPLSLVLLAGAVLALAGCPSSPTQPARPDEFTVVFIGAPAGATSFVPTDVENGRVVGIARIGGQAVAMGWANEVFTPVGPSLPDCDVEPADLSAGRVVGRARCTGDEFGWTWPNETARIDAAPHLFVQQNAAGQIAGTRNPGPESGAAARRAFLLAGGVQTVLLPPEAEASEAAGISDAGQVVVTGYTGCTATGCTGARVFSYLNGAWTRMPMPRGTDSAVAVAVSSDGRVAGYESDRFDRVFMWRIGRKLQSLPVVPGTTVQVYDINAIGQVVGQAFRPNRGDRAENGALWGGERLYYLSERIDVGVWEIESALATDDAGNVVAIGTNPETGQSGAVLLIPTG